MAFLLLPVTCYHCLSNRNLNDAKGWNLLAQSTLILSSHKPSPMRNAAACCKEFKIIITARVRNCFLTWKFKLLNAVENFRKVNREKRLKQWEISIFFLADLITSSIASVVGNRQLQQCERKLSLLMTSHGILTTSQNGLWKKKVITEK